MLRLFSFSFLDFTTLTSAVADVVCCPSAGICDHMLDCPYFLAVLFCAHALLAFCTAMLLCCRYHNPNKALAAQDCNFTCSAMLNTSMLHNIASGRMMQC